MSRAHDPLLYHQPYPLSVVSDQPDAACNECSDEFKYPASELTTIRVHRPRRPDGHWLVFCAEHLAEYLATDHPEDEAATHATTTKTRAKKKAATTASGAGPGTDPAGAAGVGASPAAAAKSRQRSAAVAPDPVAPPQPVMCPNCFVEPSLSGTCPMCGDVVAA